MSDANDRFGHFTCVASLGIVSIKGALDTAVEETLLDTKATHADNVVVDNSLHGTGTVLDLERCVRLRAGLGLLAVELKTGMSG